MMSRTTRTVFRLSLVSAAAAVLTACASGPSSNISLIPADQIASETSKSGMFTQPVRWERKKPGCEGECPTVKLESIVFPGVPKLTALVDHALATMTGVGTAAPDYVTIEEYKDHFWKTAAPRDSTFLAAKTRYRNANLTVIELDTWQYFTGAAHGITATQFLNWDNKAHRVLGIEDILEPYKHSDYVAALQKAHAQWLAANPDARHDPESYRRMWPFQASDNYAFTDQGLLVKYDSYQIAPYSFGQPELLIPYDALAGVLKAQYMPAPT